MDDSYEAICAIITGENNPIKASSRPVLEAPNGSDYHQRKVLTDGS